MRLLFVIGSLEGKGGTERVTTLIASGLANKGFKVSVLSVYGCDKSSYEIDEKVDLLSFSKSTKSLHWRYVGIVKKLRALCKSENFDLVIDVDIYLSIFSVPALAFQKRVRHWSWEHFNFQTNIDRKLRWLSKRISALFCNKIITLTEADAESYKKAFPWKSTAIESIYNPCSFEKVDGDPAGKKVCLAVGRLEDQKGFDLLVGIWSKVTVEHPDWVLKVIGSGSLSAQLEQQVAQLGMSHSVEFISHTDNIADYYREASALLMTSRFEGLPMTLIEGKAFGLPIIAYDCPTGPSEIIKNDKDGYLIPLGNQEDYILKLSGLLNDKAKREMFSKNSLLDNRFEQSTVIIRWEGLLR